MYLFFKKQNIKAIIYIIYLVNFYFFNPNTLSFCFCIRQRRLVEMDANEYRYMHTRTIFLTTKYALLPKYKNKTIKKIPYIYYKIRDFIYIHYMFTILYNFKDDIIFVSFALKTQNNLCWKKEDDLCDRTGFVEMDIIIFLN